ncbi:coat protein [Mosquito VEM virus SDRBAJ]|uniref:coat protein n=1 Tax=Mosquito VEM virus SDRBAJ TaxID=1034806 RepID=UPI000211765D|nr:coat protein [Mosquito VEM virus SDRBAJ]AEF58776.1 coat protein [Mosquito VEM virus SDRBAJ]
MAPGKKSLHSSESNTIREHYQTLVVFGAGGTSLKLIGEIFRSLYSQIPIWLRGIIIGKYPISIFLFRSRFRHNMIWEGLTTGAGASGRTGQRLSGSREGRPHRGCGALLAHGPEVGGNTYPHLWSTHTSGPRASLWANPSNKINPVIHYVYTDSINDNWALNLAKVYKIPVIHKPRSGPETTYWPSGHIQTMPRYSKPIPMSINRRRAWQAAKDKRYIAYGKARATVVVPGYTRTGGTFGRFTGGPGSENKFFDTALGFSFDSTGEVPATGQLNLIPQGVTESTRVGRSCILKSIQIKGRLRFDPGAAADSSTIAYLYLVQDSQCNGAAAAVTDVLTSATMAGAIVNMDNSQRFRILKKWTWALNSASGVSTAYNTVDRAIDYYRKCHIPLDFSSTTGAIGEIRSNNVFLLAGSADTDDLVAFSGVARVRFSDK